jgi:hypothetical protein
MSSMPTAFDKRFLKPPESVPALMGYSSTQQSFANKRVRQDPDVRRMTEWLKQGDPLQIAIGAERKNRWFTVLTDGCFDPDVTVDDETLAKGFITAQIAARAVVIGDEIPPMLYALLTEPARLAIGDLASDPKLLESAEYAALQHSALEGDRRWWRDVERHDINPFDKKVIPTLLPMPNGGRGRGWHSLWPNDLDVDHVAGMLAAANSITEGWLGLSSVVSQFGHRAYDPHHCALALRSIVDALGQEGINELGVALRRMERTPHAAESAALHLGARELRKTLLTWPLDKAVEDPVIDEPTSRTILDLRMALGETKQRLGKSADYLFSLGDF